MSVFHELSQLDVGSIIGKNELNLIYILRNSIFPGIALFLRIVE